MKSSLGMTQAHAYIHALTHTCSCALTYENMYVCIHMHYPHIYMPKKVNHRLPPNLWTEWGPVHAPNSVCVILSAL